jgi:hypothetical protein
MADKRAIQGALKASTLMFPQRRDCRHMLCMPSMPWSQTVNLKTALIAVTAAVALLGAAIIGVPTTSDKASDTSFVSTPADQRPVAR